MSSFRELAQPIRGIICPMVTPLTSRVGLDGAGLERLVEHLIHGGIHGVFILGTCGEGLSLSQRLRCELIEHTCHQIRSRVPVLVSISNTSREESLALARYAADAGADALVLAPPCYYSIEQDELLEYVRGIVCEAPLPVLLYNMPSLTKVTFDPATMERLLDETAIAGFKDSSGDLGYFQSIRQLTRQRPDCTLLTGVEHLLSRSLELGSDGGICGGANVWPDLFVQIYEASTSFSDTAIDDHKDVVSDLIDKADRLGQMYQIGTRSTSAMVKGLKTALSLLGICDDFVAEPLQRYTARERRQIEAMLRAIGLDSAHAANDSRNYATAAVPQS